jgi:hypothetical protein
MALPEEQPDDVLYLLQCVYGGAPAAPYLLCGQPSIDFTVNIAFPIFDEADMSAQVCRSRRPLPSTHRSAPRTSLAKYTAERSIVGQSCQAQVASAS